MMTNGNMIFLTAMIHRFQVRRKLVCVFKFQLLDSGIIYCFRAICRITFHALTVKSLHRSQNWSSGSSFKTPKE